MPMMRSQRSIDSTVVKVGAQWRSSRTLAGFTIVTECVSVAPDRFEAVLSVQGKPVYRSARHNDLTPAERDAENWLANRLVALLAGPDGIREPGPGFYDPQGRWSPTSEDF